MLRHPGVYKTRLHAHDVNACTKKTVTQAAEISRKSCFGAAIDVIALAPAVARHRGDDGHAARALGGQLRGRRGGDGRGDRVVDAGDEFEIGDVVAVFAAHIARDQHQMVELAGAGDEGLRGE